MLNYPKLGVNYPSWIIRKGVYVPRNPHGYWACEVY